MQLPDQKQELMGVYDTLMNLKRDSAELEDEIRELRSKLRFKSEDYEFRTPFRYLKSQPDQPLCMKCFARDIAAPMSEPFQSNTLIYRTCLVCSELEKVGESPSPHASGLVGGF